jgi:hypothetical protein
MYNGGSGIHGVETLDSAITQFNSSKYKHALRYIQHWMDMSLHMTTGEMQCSKPTKQPLL